MGSFCSCLKGEEESSMVRRVVSPSEVKRPFSERVMRRKKASRTQKANHSQERTVRPEYTNRRTSIEMGRQPNPLPSHIAGTVSKKQGAPSGSASNVAYVAQVSTRRSMTSYSRNSSNSLSDSLVDDVAQIRYWDDATNSTSEPLEQQTIGDVGTFINDATMTQKTIVDEFEGSPITTPTSIVPRNNAGLMEVSGSPPVSHGAGSSNSPAGSGRQRDDPPAFSRDDSSSMKKTMSREHTRLKYESHLPVSLLVKNFERIEAESKLL